MKQRVIKWSDKHKWWLLQLAQHIRDRREQNARGKTDFRPLKQGLGQCQFHNNEKEEMAAHKWLWTQEPISYCNTIVGLMTRWPKYTNMFRNYFEKYQHFNETNALHLTSHIMFITDVNLSIGCHLYNTSLRISVTYLTTLCKNKNTYLCWCQNHFDYSSPVLLIQCSKL